MYGDFGGELSVTSCQEEELTFLSGFEMGAVATLSNSVRPRNAGVERREDSVTIDVISCEMTV